MQAGTSKLSNIAAVDPLIGQSIGSYEVVRMLGKGGMGAVYEIHHPGIGKRLALKLLHGEFASKPDIVRRFFDEARSVNVIGHPNIVDILDFNTLPDGRPYLTMEFLEGEDLSALLRRAAPMQPTAVLELLAPACSALEAAHAAGITHRDLKPDNLFIENRAGGPRVVVLDFGIAKLSPDLSDGGPTATGVLLGTPAYMAPEQATGQSRSIGPWTDVYALGCITYEMLTGHPPFDASTLAELLTKHAYESAPTLSTSRPDLAASWSDAVARALDKDPGRRFASAGRFLDALTATTTPTVIGKRPRPLSSPPAPRAAPLREVAEAPSGGWLIPAASAAMLIAAGVAVYLILAS